MDVDVVGVAMVWVFMMSSSVLCWMCLRLLSDIAACARRCEEIVLDASVQQDKLGQALDELDSELNQTLVEMTDRVRLMHHLRRPQSPTEASAVSTNRNVVGGPSAPSDDDIGQLQASSDTEMDGSLTGARAWSDSALRGTVLQGSSRGENDGDLAFDVTTDSDPDQISDQRCLPAGGPGAACGCGPSKDGDKMPNVTQLQAHGSHGVHQTFDHEESNVSQDRQSTAFKKRRIKNLRLRRNAVETAGGPGRKGV